jgi:prepilin-type N-terminal cleavage/methylation domain-containing protein
MHRRSGFTFTEVMFAVIILGVGFVMIAAILPVAIQQSKANVDEATAAAIAQSAVSAITNCPTNVPAGAPPGTVIATPSALFPPTATAAGKGRVYFFGETSTGGDAINPGIAAGLAATPPRYYFQPDEQINALIGSMIFKTDPRFAWIGFYQRDMLNATTPASFAKLTILTVQSQLRAIYTLDCNEPAGCDFPYTLSGSNVTARVDAAHPLQGTFRPQITYVYLTERINQPNLLTFVAKTGGGFVNEPRAGEGAFVIIADSTASDTAGAIPANSGRGIGDLNGKVYRLGRQITDPNTTPPQLIGSWELQPGYDMTYSVLSTSPAVEYNENVPYRLSSSTATPPTSGTPALAFIVGRGLAGPASPPSSPPTVQVNGSIPEDDDSSSPRAGGATNVPGGPAQDLSVFQCIVPIPQ